jgi:adenine deaminase
MLDGHVIGEVRLPIGGLMSDKDAVETAREVKELADVVSTRLGLTLDAPFMQLSFLGLTVIPELRMTDRGLLDVSTFSIVDVAAG